MNTFIAKVAGSTRLDSRMKMANFKNVKKTLAITL